MLKLGLILQIMNYIDHYVKKKIKKVVRLMKDELGRKIMTKFVVLSAKTYCRLIIDDTENKEKQKALRSVS